MWFMHQPYFLKSFEDSKSYAFNYFYKIKLERYVFINWNLIYALKKSNIKDISQPDPK